MIDGVLANDFELEYQPIFDLRAQTMIGAEALIRWRKRDRSLIPQEILSASDMAVLLDRVGLLAIRRAADEIFALTSLQLSVTISRDLLVDPVFAEKIAGTLRATKFAGERLQLAVDVRQLPPADAVRTAVADLKRSGVGIAFNDVALGMKTLDYLQPGLADRVRLPSALVAGIDTDLVRYTLVEATITAAKSAGLAITVPGVTRKEEVGKVLRLGCREFQGPLFAPPMPIGALTQLVLRPPARQAS